MQFYSQYHTKRRLGWHPCQKKAWLASVQIKSVWISAMCPVKLTTIELTSSAWENLLWRFSDRHRIRHFHMAMIKGIIYTNLAISVSPCGIRVLQSKTRISQRLTEIAKLVYIIPFIIATWKWEILWRSPNLHSRFSHAELVKCLIGKAKPVTGIMGAVSTWVSYFPASSHNRRFPSLLELLR